MADCTSKVKNTLYERDKLSFDLKFNYAKELFIAFILQKKRTNDEIDVWLKTYTKDICEKLESMTSRKFTIDELNSTKENIKRLIKELKDKETQLKEAENIFNNFADPTLIRGVTSKKNSASLFETDDITEDITGIAIWNGNDVFDEENDINNEND